MWPFKQKNLEDHLAEIKRVNVQGIIFKFKKIDPSNFMDGSKVMLQIFEIYKIDPKRSDEENVKNLGKIKEHYRDVFMAAVVEPKLKRKPDEEGILVDNLFTDWVMCHELYAHIMEYTYGKKK
jgi:hypothetical protein